MSLVRLNSGDLDSFTRPNNPDGWGFAGHSSVTVGTLSVCCFSSVKLQSMKTVSLIESVYMERSWSQCRVPNGLCGCGH